MSNEDPRDAELLQCRCPIDNTLVFEYSQDMSGIVRGKCRKCRALVYIDKGVVKTEK